jgi:hypothetical protein
VAIVPVLHYVFGFPIFIITIFSLILLLSSLVSAILAITIRQFRHWQIRPCASLLSLILLVSGFILLAIPIIQSLITSPLKVSRSETYRYILEYITAPISVVTVLFDAFLVKPYFREVAKTGNELRDINIREVTVKKIEGKEIGKHSNYSGSVIQCSLRLRSEHFAVPIYAKNATGWVALINKARNIELHAGYAPWGYSHHYVLDIVGEESLILFFIQCDNMQCRNLAEQLRDCLSGKGCGLKSIDIMFPVRPVEITRNWDRGIAVEFQIPINELNNLRLRVRAGGENTTIYENEFELREVITSCIDDYLRRN